MIRRVTRVSKDPFAFEVEGLDILDWGRNLLQSGSVVSTSTYDMSLSLCGVKQLIKSELMRRFDI